MDRFLKRMERGEERDRGHHRMLNRRLDDLTTMMIIRFSNLTAAVSARFDDVSGRRRITQGRQW